MHGVNLSLGKRRETALQRGRSPRQRPWFAKHRFEPMTKDQIARTSSTSEDARKWPARDVSKLVLDGDEQTFEARRMWPTRGSHGIPRIAGNRLSRRRMLACQTNWTHQQQKLRETRCEIVSPVYFKGNFLWLPKHLILPSSIIRQPCITRLLRITICTLHTFIRMERLQRPKNIRLLPMVKAKRQHSTRLRRTNNLSPRDLRPP